MRRRGFTLVEALTALTVISVLLAMSVPSVARTMEQVHADLAGAHLKTIWNAQRFYWLSHRVYATNLATLEAAELLDPAVSAASGRYAFAIESATTSTFQASATRTGSGVWAGKVTIDQTGSFGGSVHKTGADYVITPGFSN